MQMVLGKLIEDMVTDNSNNVRVVAEAERLANFLLEQKPVSKKKNKRNTEKHEKEEAALRSVSELMSIASVSCTFHFLFPCIHGFNRILSKAHVHYEYGKAPHRSISSVGLLVIS